MPSQKRVKDNENQETFQKSLEFLDSLHFQGVKLGLDNTVRMLEKVNNPHTRLKAVHVGGTNGKGSISAMLVSALRKSGLKTGFYSSPHLLSIRERIRIDGTAVSKKEFASLVFYVKRKTAPLIEQSNGTYPTFFEFLTVMALVHFYREQTDIAIIEVGLGGRLDSTNVIIPSISVISCVQYDHLKPLGSDLHSIAYEKAGIIKEGVPVICGESNPIVREVIHKKAQKTNSDLYNIGEDFDAFKLGFVEEKGQLLQRNQVSWKNRKVEIHCPIVGHHQLKNIAVAYATIMLLIELGIKILPKLAISGFRTASWPGRFHQLNQGLILDAAHNASAVKELVTTLDQLFPGRKWNVLFAVCKDKEWEQMLTDLVRVSKSFVLVSLDFPRTELPKNIEKFLSKKFSSDQNRNVRRFPNWA